LLNGGLGLDADNATANIFRSDEPNPLQLAFAFETNKWSGHVVNSEEMYA